MPTSWQQLNNDPNIMRERAQPLNLSSQAYLTALIHTEILTIEADLHKARELMQGQFTCDINQLSENNSLLGACCNPQGRILATFRIFQHQEHYHLSLPQGTAELLKAHLDKFAMFYRAKLVINPEIKILGLMGVPATTYINKHVATLDSTSQQFNKNKVTLIQAHGKNRYEVYGAEAELNNELLNKSFFTLAPSSNWYQGEIDCGIVQITPATSGQFLPHDLSLDKTGVIDFNKGCYSGQEIIARMHYRGTPKRSGFIIHWQGAPAHSGDIVYDNQNKKAGMIINSVRLENDHNIAFCSLNHQQLDAHLTIHRCPLQLT